MRIRTIYVLILISLLLTSCLITSHIGNLQVEVMRPGIINIPADDDSIAIVYIDPFLQKSDTFKYYNGLKLVSDSTVKYEDFFRACTDSLEKGLKYSGYFRQVSNFHEMPDEFTADGRLKISKLFHETNSDVCLMLEYINFNNSHINHLYHYSSFPAELIWIILFRNDTIGYTYHQTDTLYYDYTTFDSIASKDNVIQPLLENAAGYLGKTCASKLVPDWIPVERMYYQSANPEMLRAENYALKNDWIDAAEIWNKLSENKNERIAAKAAFNMGLACEMEGKPDLAIDWLLVSARKLTKNYEDHRINCQRYITVLQSRKKDIYKLGKQVRRSNESEVTKPE